MSQSKSIKGEPEQQPLSIEIEEKIVKLKKQKAAAKTAVTKNKNKLLKLLEEELPNRQTIRDTIDQLGSLQNKAIDVIFDLATAYKDAGDIGSFRKTSREIEVVEEESEEAIAKAQVFLKNTLDTSSVKSIPTGISRLFRSEKGEHSNTKDNGELNGKKETGESRSLGAPYIFHEGSQDNRIGNDLWKQLKRVSIPVFSGNVREYEGWKAAFMTCVDRAPATNEYKLLQLKQYLTGEAAQLVNKLGHSAAVYTVAIERLDRKYGGKRRQIALHMEEISNFKPLRPGNSKDLDKFADMLDVAVVTLRESDKVEELGDGCLYSLLLKKLTEIMIQAYKRWVYEHQRQESVETLREWILLESEFQTVAYEVKQGFSSKSKPDQCKSGTYYGAKMQDRTYQCQLCRASGHKIWQCKDFQSLDISSRWVKAKELGLCFRCLSGKHLGKSCSRTVVCGIDGCKANHNRLLHDSTSQNNVVGSSPDTKTNRLESTHVTSDSERSGVKTQTTMSSLKDRPHTIALRTVPVVLRNGNKRLVVNALLDDASTQTYINEDVASELGLKGEMTTVSVNVVNNRTESFNSMSVECDLESLDGSVKTRIGALTTNRVTGNMKVIDWHKQGQKWKHLKDIQFPQISSRPVVDILIGIDYMELHYSQGDVCGGKGEPVARLTPLGWTCVGSASGKNPKQQTGTFFIRNENVCDDNIDCLVQKFWEVEDISSPKAAMSVDEQVAVEVVKNSLEYHGDRYRVGIPWKENANSLPDNYSIAFNRLLGIEKKLDKEKAISDAYSEVITQHLAKGYVRKVPANEVKETNWYLPHFPIIKPDRKTTKVRIVFDASAKCKGLSLNDCIHQGPKLQNDLFEILLRFRRFPVAIICDIAEMYLQIEILEKDRSHFRFLWRDMDESKTPDVYEFSRIVFGVNCSPFIAQYISQEHAKSHSEHYPLAAQTICESTYMDDNMDSVENDTKAKDLCKQLNELWSSAGMHARKWMSNSLEVLDQIPKDDRLNEIDIQLSELPSVKALGLTWNPKDDEFRFSCQIQDKDFIVTKRKFLREAAKIFDPLGFLSPFSIRAKIILQQMWIAGMDWDDIVGPELAEKARQWYYELGDLSSLQVPRCIHLEPNITKLHVFVDASQDAYGAVIYAVTDKNGTLTSQLVASKNRVAPIKAVSIPRLELMAAVLGVKLLTAVVKALQIAFRCATLWTDSTNVLWWIKSQSRCFKTFIANRVGYIQEKTNPNQWQHVPSQLNAADILSRGSHTRALAERDWLYGPDFLVLDESKWPDQVKKFSIPENLEQKKHFPETSVTMLTTQLEAQTWILEPSRFSDWKRLCRVYAWVFRYLNNTRLPVNARKSGCLDPEEIDDAETKVLVTTQNKAFHSEYVALAKGNHLQTASKLLPLKPFIDEHGLLRSAGRLRYAEVLSYDARCPIILPKDDHVTKLIIKHYHEKVLHLGTNNTLASISSRFWIISAREEIRKWEKECAWCRRRKAKPAHQIMADLPSIRVKASLRAFEQVGVDFAGPFLTVQGRGKQRQKRYLCLFTCLSTRAVHLEIAYGLDTDSFLRALFRMTDRRGMPKQILSDNGTNFVGAVKEMKGLIRGLDSNVVKSSLANKGIVWQFNPPHAPHFGGVFESMIKSAKRAIFAILSSGSVTDEELMSAFTSAEGLINGRPLTYQSAHPDDLLPLTPNHFLHGQMGGELAPALDELCAHPNARWRRVQELVRHVWKRWMREWLPTLNIRRKWFNPSRDIQVGDVVIVVSPDSPRGSWPLGRITETYAGKDGHIRVVQVKVGKTKLTRPITKVCPLEWN